MGVLHFDGSAQLLSRVGVNKPIPPSEGSREGDSESVSSEPQVIIEANVGAAPEDVAAQDEPSQPAAAASATQESCP